MMNREEALTTVAEHVDTLADTAFEVCCKMLLDRESGLTDVRLVPADEHSPITIRATVAVQLLEAKAGVAVIHGEVDRSTVHEVAGALRERQCKVGSLVTRAEVTNGASNSAKSLGVMLIDGDTLVETLLDAEVGIDRTEEGYRLDDSFWATFEGPEREATIPSIEVPQADNFDTLRYVLRAIDVGADVKPQISDFVKSETGSTFAPRQADYYGIAGWLLGFLHREKREEVDGQTVRRWGVTRRGRQYLALGNAGDDARAAEILQEAIHDVEAVSRVKNGIRTGGPLTRNDVADILATEAHLSESTARRRATTVGAWLSQLPEISMDESENDRHYRLAES